MAVKKVKITSVKENPENPRTINEDKFNKLVKSIKEFPEMLKLRPIVVDENMVILGGNMRYKASQKLGLKDIFIVQASDLTEEQKKEFIIKDNVGFGAWDWDMIANEWETETIADWGMDVFMMDDDLDYSILDDDEAENDLDELNNGVKKAIMIEFDLEVYPKAFELIKYWRDQNADVGLMLIEKLQDEKK